MPRHYYISGPITGVDNFRIPFDRAAERLRAEGHRVTNPCDVILPEGATWSNYMRADIKLMMDCDAICMLSKWENSRGAREEYRLAVTLGFAIHFADELVVGEVVA